MSDRPAQGAASARSGWRKTLKTTLMAVAAIAIVAEVTLYVGLSWWTKLAGSSLAAEETDGREWVDLALAEPDPPPSEVPAEPAAAAVKAAESNDPEPPTAPIGLGRGALVISGGGKLPDEVRRRFVELAGGAAARIVVIPTAHDYADTPAAIKALDVWAPLGVTAVQLLHTRSRDRANDPEFVKPLIDATGVWLGGGRQEKLTSVYIDTEVERQLKGVLDRGGVIGGSSAGAAAMTRLMIAGGRNGRVTEGRGFDLLPGAVVDQHFFRRNRVSRLFIFLSSHPRLYGFGIDERTALVIRGQEVNVLGESYVLACLPGAAGHPERMRVLKAGDKADLQALIRPSVPGLPEPPRRDAVASSASRGDK